MAMVKAFLIPLYWEMYGRVEVQSESLEDAIKYVMGPKCSLPEGSYVDDSLNVDYEMIEEEANEYA